MRDYLMRDFSAFHGKYNMASSFSLHVVKNRWPSWLRSMPSVFWGFLNYIYFYRSNVLARVKLWGFVNIPIVQHELSQLYTVRLWGCYAHSSICGGGDPKIFGFQFSNRPILKMIVEFFLTLMVHKPSLGPCDLPQQVWVRSVQLFWC